MQQPTWRPAQFIAPQAQITAPLPVREALDFWAKKHSEFQARHHNLLLLGGTFTLFGNEHETFKPLNLEQQLRLAEAHPIKEFFAKREKNLKNREGDPSQVHRAALDSLDLKLPASPSAFSPHYDWGFLEEDPEASVALADLPGTPLEAIAAIMRFAPGDDWTRHEPYEHAQVAAHWSKELGAEVIYLDGKSIYFVLDRPPRTVDAAKRAVWQGYLYNDAEEYLAGTANSMTDYAQAVASTAHWGFNWD